MLYLFVVFVVSHLGFEDGNLILIVPVPGHCFRLLKTLLSKCQNQKQNSLLVKRQNDNIAPEACHDDLVNKVKIIKGRADFL